MRRAVKLYLTPGWVALTLLAWAAAVAMVLLGRWQLRVSDAKHFDLQNFGYAFQWWAFSACAVLFWMKLLRDAWRGGSSAGASTGGELVVRAGQAGGIAHVGPAELVAPGRSGGEPVVYRGYRMPQSAVSPARSEGDELHASYNDYLWQLALADAADRPAARLGADPQPGSDPPASRPPTGRRRSGEQLADHSAVEGPAIDAGAAEAGNHSG